MKKIEAVVRPEKFDVIRMALEEQGYGGVTVTEVKGHGKQKGIEEVWRGRKYRIDMMSKLKLDLVVPDSDVDKVVKTIISEARTESVGDGKIFVSDVNTAYRIRTGEKGDAALL